MKSFYRAITDEGCKRAEECSRVSYPGQNGDLSGRLSFETATEAALCSIATLKPDWVIGTSFGALVVMGLARRRFFADALGLVLVGPTTRNGIQRIAPDQAARAQIFARYQKEYDTWLDDKFFMSLPAAEELIDGVLLPLRMIRGEFD